MMKRLSLKGLRISAAGQKEEEPCSPDDSVGGAEYELPQPVCHHHAKERRTPEGSPRRRPHDSPSSTPGSRRKDKKGFFKTLRRKFTPSFRTKRESTSSGVIEDDSSSDTLEGCRGAKGGSRSPHRRASSRDRREQSPSVPGGKKRPPIPKSDDVWLPHPTKEELSKSTEDSSSPNEDDKGQILADAEYGHASAPSGNQLTVGSFDTPQHSPAAVRNSRTRDGSVESSVVAVPPVMTRTIRTNNQLPPVPPKYDPEHDHDPTDSDHPKCWSITKELFRLSRYGWFWGPINRKEAEEKLEYQPDGAFLVRHSSDERHLLSLSFRSFGRTLHTRIEHCNGMFSFYAPETEGFSSIVELIEHSMSDSQTGVFCYSRARSQGSPSFPVRLTKPVSRFMQVRSLQYLCRFVIRQYTRLDHLQKLPLPASIKGWLEENQY